MIPAASLLLHSWPGFPVSMCPLSLQKSIHIFLPVESIAFSSLFSYNNTEKNSQTMVFTEDSMDYSQYESQKTGYLKEDFRLFHIKDQTEREFSWHYHDFHKIVEIGRAHV